LRCAGTNVHRDSTYEPALQYTTAHFNLLQAREKKQAMVFDKQGRLPGKMDDGL
jgi:hypothetical protein